MTVRFEIRFIPSQGDKDIRRMDRKEFIHPDFRAIEGVLRLVENNAIWIEILYLV